MAKITTIEGIGEAYAEKLMATGVTTVEGLLEVAGTRAGRAELAQQTGIRADLLLGWVNRADLHRIRGVGEEYADLLEAAGVDTVPELAQRNPQNLHARLLEVNEERSLVRRVPPLNQVQDWVAQAKELPRKIEY